MGEKTNAELYDAAMEAVTELFGDLTVNKTQTMKNLQTLVDEIEVMINSLVEETNHDAEDQV